MGEKTHRNLYEAFVGEAKAHFRLLAYAEKAEEEELPQITALFSGRWPRPNGSTPPATSNFWER